MAQTIHSVFITRFRNQVSEAVDNVKNVEDMLKKPEGHIDTQAVRRAALNWLTELLKMAKLQSEDVALPPKQRKDWATSACYAAQVMAGFLEGLEKRATDEDLLELERLIDEVQAKAGVGKGKAQVGAGESAEASAESS